MISPNTLNERFWLLITDPLSSIFNSSLKHGFKGIISPVFKTYYIKKSILTLQTVSIHFSVFQVQNRRKYLIDRWRLIVDLGNVMMKFNASIIILIKKTWEKLIINYYEYILIHSLEVKKLGLYLLLIKKINARYDQIIN